MDVVREQLKMAFKEQCRVEVQPWDMDGRAEVQPRGVAIYGSQSQSMY